MRPCGVLWLPLRQNKKKEGKRVAAHENDATAHGADTHVSS